MEPYFQENNRYLKKREKKVFFQSSLPGFKGAVKRFDSIQPKASANKSHLGMTGLSKHGLLRSFMITTLKPMNITVESNLPFN